MTIKTTLAACAAIAMAFGLGACGRQAQASTAEGCGVHVEAPWRPATGEHFAVSATAEGPDCERATLTLAIRDQQGNLAHVDALYAPEVGIDATTADDMHTALARWIDPAHGGAMSHDLPDWPKGAPAPLDASYAPNPELGQARYETWRASSAPVFCYAQDPTGNLCVYLGAETGPMAVKLIPH